MAENGTGFIVRRATPGDIKALVRHRCMMFFDMGRLREEYYEQLAAESEPYFAEALRTGEYVAWVVAPSDDHTLIVAGGGMQLRRILPRPNDYGVPLGPGPQGLIVNVYTEKEWRKRGLAKLVMETIIAWSKENGVTSLVLHASQMGRPIYEQLGFVASNEMVYPTRLLQPSDYPIRPEE